MTSSPVENFIDSKVTYTINLDGNLYVIENVPARISERTGEQLFSPETVEQIHRIIRGGRPPVRTLQVGVFEFAA
jgi:hypothetical protein